MIDPIEIRLAGIHAAEAANGIAAVAATLRTIAEHLSVDNPVAGLLTHRAELLDQHALKIETHVLSPLRAELRK
jgi:hypothetical protein